MINYLDGKTILRFAHAFESGGGMEQLLDDLDRMLLMRNRMKIIRIYIASDRDLTEERNETIGQGSLIRVPLKIPNGESSQLASDEECSGTYWRSFIRDYVLYNPLLWELCVKRYILKRPVPRQSGQILGAGLKVAELIRRNPIDLIMLHFIGGADSDEVVQQATLHKIPFAVQNHFSNERFLHLSIRKHATLAAGIAGVNGLGVPKYLQNRFCNLADGIDTEFFTRENVKPRIDPSLFPIVLLPARVVQPKGHLDLVHAARKLHQRGIKFTIAFAGRVDSTQFVDLLHKEINRFQLKNRIMFLGALTQKELREWYAASAVVALPTYHHEGLGRVNVEAQCMKVPVVAYATGGVPEGILSGRTGFLLKTGDIEGLAVKLDELLSNPEMRQTMGEEGRRFIENRYSLESQAKRHEEFYLNVLQSGGRQRR